MRENEIQKEIMLWLERAGFLVWRNHAVYRRDYRNVVRAGLPDLFVIVRGVVVGIEVKTPTGRLSDEQKDFALLLRQHGGFYVTATSLNDVINFLSEERLLGSQRF